MSGDLAAICMGIAGAVIYLGYVIDRKRRRRKEQQELREEFEEEQRRWQ